MRNIVVFYWLNRLNWLKNQVLCGVAVVANRLKNFLLSVKRVKNGGFVGFLHLTKKLRGFLRVPGMRFQACCESLPGWDKVKVI